MTRPTERTTSLADAASCREIRKLTGKVAERGFSLIPLQLYFRNGKIKVRLALAKGKRAYDKRESIRKKDQRREMERLAKYRQR